VVGHHTRTLRRIVAWLESYSGMTMLEPLIHRQISNMQSRRRQHRANKTGNQNRPNAASSNSTNLKFRGRKKDVELQQQRCSTLRGRRQGWSTYLQLRSLQHRVNVNLSFHQGYQILRPSEEVSDQLTFNFNSEQRMWLSTKEA